MFHRFKQRGYENKVLETALTKTTTLNRKQLMSKRTRMKPQHTRIFFSTQYSNMAYKVKNAITRNWDILLSDDTLSSLFSAPPTVSFRRAPTLKDSLVKSHLPADKPKLHFPKPKGTYRCGACNHCDNIKREDKFVDVFTQRLFYCREFANCNSTFVVYRLECECGCFYVGRTKRKLRQRLAEHKNAIKTVNPNYPMAQHYKNAGHTNHMTLKAMVIETIPKSTRGGDRLKRLLQRETFWIHTLRATSYPGLNEEIDFSPFL